MADDTPRTNQTSSPGAAPAKSAEQLAVSALENAAQAAKSLSQEAASAAQSKPVQLPDFAGNGAAELNAAGLGLLDDVTLRVKVELGRTQMYVEDVLRLNTNSVVELDKAAGDPVDIYVNDRHVARGEVLVLNENFCVRISEILQHMGTDE